MGLPVLEAHAPVVADRVSQQLAILSECSGCEGCRELFGRLVFTLSVLVPHDNGAITAISRKCIVLHVEGNAIDSVDICLIFVFLFFPVALEAKIIVLTQVVLCHIVVFDAAATLDRAHRVAFTITENSDRSSRKLKR